MNLPGRPGGRLPELGISEPTLRGRTRREASPSPWLCQSCCPCSESPLHAIRSCLFRKAIIPIGMFPTPVLTEQALVLSFLAETEPPYMQRPFWPRPHGQRIPQFPLPSIPSTSHTHTLSTLLLTQLHTLSALITTPSSSSPTSYTKKPATVHSHSQQVRSLFHSHL